MREVLIKRKVHRIDTSILNKTIQAIISGETNKFISYTCGSPPLKLISFLRGEMFPETIEMNHKEFVEWRKERRENLFMFSELHLKEGEDIVDLIEDFLKNFKKTR